MVYLNCISLGLLDTCEWACIVVVLGLGSFLSFLGVADCAWSLILVLSRVIAWWREQCDIRFELAD